MELFRNGLQMTKEHSSHIKVMFLLMLLLHGAKLNAGVLGIDTEALIFREEDFYRGLLNTGRQGVVMLKYLFHNLTFNPYFAAIMTLLAFPAAVSAFYLLWSSAGGFKSNLTIWIIGGLLWISHPVLTEQLYFSSHSFEIALGFLLTAIAMYLTLLWTEKKRGLWAFCAAVVLLLLTFSIYQAFVAIYIFGAVSVLFLQTIREFSEGKGRMAIHAVKRIGSWILVFITAFLINTLITHIFFSSSNYLDGQIRWGTETMWEIFRHICGHVLSVMIGRGTIYYSAFYGCLLACSAILFVLYLYRHGRENRSGCVTVGFLYLALQSTPFLMTLIQGGEPVLRSQLILPAMTGLQAMLCLWLAQDLSISAKAAGKVIIAGVLLLSILGGVKTSRITWSLYYTDQLRYEQDVLLGRTLIWRLEEACSQEEEPLPVVIVGTRPFQGNSSCVQAQVMGQSFFDWDADVAPVPYWSTRRVLGFLNTLGADYYLPPMDRMDEALRYSESMPEWPMEDCVQIYNGMVIVKLSGTDSTD